jgi:uncharacterized integral membrane protein (TIGR00697 family)
MKSNGRMFGKDSAPPGYRYFPVVAASFVATLLLSNIAATKLIPVGPFILTGAVLLFPVTYIFGDVVTEVYGYQKARQVIWTGLFANVFMAAYFYLVVHIPPAPGWPLQQAFSQIFNTVPRIVLASIVGYWAGEFANSYVMAKMKLATDGRFLWTRTISSTLVGQAVDTVLFVAIAWSGILSEELIIRKLYSSYLFKVSYEVIATPLTYVVVNFLKRREETNFFDRRTNFSPFAWRLHE